jgi:acyl transferase domain-containing protein
MDHKNKKGQHKIAIVGTGTLVPGAVNTKDFWLNILAEKDLIKDVPETHWLVEDYYDPNSKNGDKVYCKKGAFLDDISFDPIEFGMPPNLLSTTDTVQLLSLVVARDTLADTVSYQEGKVDKNKISVILGVAGGTELIGQMAARIRTPEWTMAMRRQGLPESKIEAITNDLDKSFSKWTENTFPGLLGNVVSGRIANRFDLKGTNCVLDAACASSLAAVKMAVQELQLGSTDMVISGGCDALNDIFMYMCFSKTTALSRTEDCRPFSDAGDGTVLGEAVVMFALKRLEDAERDGDKIYAVIASIGSSSDGKTGSIYAPDSNGQSIAIRRAYEDAGFSPNQVELVEGHGTGTIAGDYAEFTGLKLGFGATEKNQYCALGSIKSMIGHTKSAAGAAGVLKAAMALNNAILPPTIKVNNPNPKLNIKDSPFYLNTTARPWIHDEDSSRKAGVSSMGFGGTNFHVVLEQYDNKAARPDKVYKAGRELFLFSGKDKKEITNALTQVMRDGLTQDVIQVAKSTQVKFNSKDSVRLAIFGETMEEVFKWCEHTLAELAKNASKVEIINSVYYSEEKPVDKIAFLFSGQGSQYVNMGADLLMQYDAALNPWNKVSTMKLDTSRRLNEIVYPIPVFTDDEKQAQMDLLVDTKWAQPAIGTLALSHLNLLNLLKVKPSVVGGHSYGEVAALYAAGIIKSQEDLINISRIRGELMAAASKEKGAMTAVLASSKEVEEVLKNSKSTVVIANINSPRQTVITGTTDAIAKIEKELENAGIRFMRLNVSTAFHSELVASSAIVFEEYLKKISFGKPNIPVYSNTTATHYPQKTIEYAKILANQLAQPVQFEKQVESMYVEGVRVFLEVGPGNVLMNFVKDILKDQSHTAISMDGGKKQNSKDAFWIAIGRLAVSGIPVSFDEIWKGIDDNKKVENSKKPSIATVKINGSNYGKPYPPEGGFKNLPKPNPEIVTKSQPKLETVSHINNHHAAPVQEKPELVATHQKNGMQKIVSSSNLKNTTLQNNTMSGINNQWLSAFQEIQKNMLESQKSFQETLAESHRQFLETSQTAFQQLGNLAGNNVPLQNTSALSFKTIAEPDPVSQPKPVSQPNPVLKHKAVEEIVVEKLQVTQEGIIAPPDIKPQNEPISKATNIDFEDTLLTIVAEKTGYPKEILDLETDLESGLGIDSIKRVEILSALQEVFPDLKKVDKAKLAGMNTLAEILNSSKSSPTQTVKAVTQPTEAISAVPENFQDTMLEIVAEKTGYPKEILDLHTDLESGLGIDSIKRVEILSALQEVFPELKNVDKAKLAAMNTLGEILHFSKGNAPAGQGAAPVATDSNTISHADLKDTMLEIVAEKTGYPKEILDLETDLESGLGIDSIKRVEILSALQEVFPDLKNVDKSKLAAMNTLGEILAYSDGTTVNEGGASANTGKKSLSTGNIFRYIVSRAPITDKGFGYTSWKKADTLYIVEDDSGVAKELEKLFRAIGSNPKVVNTLPDSAFYVINLRGLNNYTDYTVEQILAVNSDAFNVAQTCSNNLFAGKGCLILPFDNGLAWKADNNRAWSGGISALAKTAKLEWPNADVQSINIDCTEKTAESIAKELFETITSGGAITEIEIDNSGNSYQLVSTVSDVKDSSKSFNDGDTIIVSGGAKGVTAACLIAQSERKKLNIGILGRTSLEEEPSYLAGYTTDSELKNAVFKQAVKEGRKVSPLDVSATVLKILGKREIADNLKVLTKNGSVVRYLPVDISNADDVQSAVDDIRKEFGAIHGIVHAAGVLADKYIHEKTAKQFDKVFKTKVIGFKNLLEATAEDKLTHICCFSSVAARTGNVGQSDYAMANEVLNKVCQAEQKKRKNNCVVKSINWGPWDGGMVSPQLKKHFESLNIDLIPLRVGAEIFADEMEDGSIENVEIVVGGAFDGSGKKESTESKHVRNMWVHRSNNPFLESHRIEGKVIVPMMMANEWSMRLAKSIYPDMEIVEVNKMKVYKGIQLENFEKEGDILRFVYTVEKNDNSAVIHIKIEDENNHPYYAVTVNLSQKAEHAPSLEFGLKNLQSWDWKKKDIYNARLFHGPHFQVVEELQGINEDGCRGILKTTDSELVKTNEWLSDMLLFDGGIQLAVLAMDKWTGNNSSLPLGYESLKLYTSSQPSSHVHCELSLKKKGDLDSEWDIHFKDQDQRMLAEMSGLRIYMYKN